MRYIQKAVEYDDPRSGDIVGLAVEYQENRWKGKARLILRTAGEPAIGPGKQQAFIECAIALDSLPNESTILASARLRLTELFAEVE